MSGKAILLSAGCLLFAGGLLISQQPIATSESGRTPALTVTVKVVNVPATVRDKHGQLVSSLGKDDFLLEQDGRPQEVRYFSHDTDLPLTLGLLVDTSLSQRRVLDQERRASYAFLDQMLRQSKDSAFVIHFDHEVELLQDITSSREKLESALQTVQMSSDDGGGSNGGGNNGGGGWGRRGGGPYGGGGYPGGGGGHHRHSYGGGGTLLYDAAYLASDELMKKQQGRKALIILSDGVDTGSKLSLETAIEASQRADTMVYSILFVDEDAYGRGGFGGFGGRRGPGFPGDPANGKKVLEQISKQTGGRLFEVSKKQPIEKIYQSIAEELRNQYNLGYTPDKAMADGYHKINLKTKQKDLVVQAREGYYASR